MKNFEQLLEILVANETINEETKQKIIVITEKEFPNMDLYKTNIQGVELSNLNPVQEVLTFSEAAEKYRIALNILQRAKDSGEFGKNIRKAKD